ncbi:MAG: hypothetical protein OXU45_08640 [Candidatus Melainabacteria bacterium]|nr:hypothetical protein [Candidatus Melainabacteria bacterium]
MALPVQALNLKRFLRLDRMRKEHGTPFKSETLVPMHERISIALVSDINLYPAPLDGQMAPGGDLRPPLNSIVLYEESQVLLQETVRELIQRKGENAIDFVVFGGSQVYLAKDYALFVDVANDLSKFGIPYYSMLGANEAQALSYVKPYQKDNYYMLKVKDLAILLLDNVTEPVVPEYLPEEATEQYLWLKNKLAQLEREQNQVMIFAYKPLETKTKNLINKFQNLNLKLIAHSSFYEYSQYQAGKDYGLKLASKPVIVSNSSISAYPLSYTMIERDANGLLKVYNKEVDLPGLRNLAKERWN